VTNLHDSLFRYVFGQPEHAAPLLRSALPEPVTRIIDWSSLRRQPDPQVDERQQQQQCDLLFAVRLRRSHATGSAMLLHVVLEHKSRGDRFTALQMHGYAAAVLKDQRRSRPRERFLTPVVPVVVHCGPRPWRAPRQLRDLFDLAALPVELIGLLPQSTFVLDDIAERSEVELRGRALSVAGLWALAALQFLPPVAEDADAFGRWLQRWGDVMHRAVVAPTGQDAVSAVTSYILRIARLDRPRLEVVMHEHTSDTVMKKFVSTWDRAIGEARRTGRHEGRHEGREEGLAAGRAELVLRLLERRFGGEAAAFAARIRNASVLELDRWAERLLDAATIDDVFRGP
jgi:hypothetical protein